MTQRTGSRATGRAAGNAQTVWVPIGLTIVLFLLSFLPRVQGNVVLTQDLLDIADLERVD